MSARSDKTPDPGASYTTYYPRGGTSRSHGGKGIFVNPETDEGLDIWLDLDLRGRGILLKALESEGARISTNLNHPSTSLLILSPRSVTVFDTYCHPEWLPPDLRLRYQRRRRKGLVREEPWTRKVLLKDGWVTRCKDRGRFLGEEDQWGTLRAGGPPASALRKGVPQAAAPMNDEGSHDSNPPQPAAFGNKAMQNRAEAIDDVDEPMELDFESPTPALLDQDTEGRLLATGDTAATSDARQNEADKSGDPEESVSIANEARPMSPSEPLCSVPATLRAVEASEEQDSEMRRDPAILLKPSDEDRSDITSEVGAPTHQSAHELRANTESESTEPSGKNPRGHSPRLDVVTSPVTTPKCFAAAASRGHAPLETSSSQLDSSVIRPPEGPSKLFAGLRFWVDLARPGRKDLIKRIRDVGGEICSDYPQATHVLIHETKPHKWNSIIRDVVQQGVWFMHVSWVIQCMDEKRRVPELGHHLPGGAPVLLGVESPARQVYHSASGGGSQARMSSAEISKILGDESHILNSGGTQADLFHLLASKYGTYTARSWKNLYQDWHSRTGRFVPSLPERPGKVLSAKVSPPPSTPAPKTGPRETSQTASGLSGSALAKIFEDEEGENRVEPLTDFCESLAEKYGEYSPEKWHALFVAWTRRKGRPIADIPDYHPEDSTTSANRAFPQTPNELARTDKLSKIVKTEDLTGDLHSQVPQSLSTTEMAGIFQEHLPLLQSGMTRSALGELLAADNGTYAASTWSQQFSHWKRAEGRFKDFVALEPREAYYRFPETPKRTSADRKATSRKRSAEKSASASPVKQIKRPKLAYTEAEERSMADYIKRKTADGTKFSNGDWEAFARDLPERPASSYLQHYMAYQERIDGYVLDFEGGRTVPPEASIPPSSTQITKRSSVYSEAEERGMAQCIRQRLPMETRPCPKDWEVYALESASRRTASAYSQKYGSFKNRIDGFVSELDGEETKVHSAVLGHHRAEARFKRDASEGANSVICLGENPSGPSSSAHELIEIDSD